MTEQPATQQGPSEDKRREDSMTTQTHTPLRVLNDRAPDGSYVVGLSADYLSAPVATVRTEEMAHFIVRACNAYNAADSREQAANKRADEWRYEAEEWQRRCKEAEADRDRANGLLQRLADSLNGAKFVSIGREMEVQANVTRAQDYLKGQG